MIAAKSTDARDKSILPIYYRELLEKLVQETDDPNGSEIASRRVAADLVSSLTEQQAGALYHRLTGSESGTIFTRIVR